ncbi:putative secreted protein, signal peptide with several threonines, possible mucin [Cryptosporidium felis]|nr:putative secreted protein, signal peptide with several threonines, possible mucin [Cryptosporidium felis]
MFAWGNSCLFSGLKWSSFIFAVSTVILTSWDQNIIQFNADYQSINKGSFLALSASNFGTPMTNQIQINSKLTHYDLSGLSLQQIEHLIIQLETEISLKTKEFYSYKKDSSTIRNKYEKHKCATNPEIKKGKNNRCQTCEKRATALKRLRLLMKDLVEKIVQLQLNLDKCMYRRDILNGKVQEKKVMHRPFSVAYGKTSQEDKEAARERRKAKFTQREKRRESRIQEKIKAGGYSKHDMDLMLSHGHEIIDKSDPNKADAIFFFRPKTSHFLTEKLLSSISHILSIFKDFTLEVCKNDLILIKVESIQKLLKKHYKTKLLMFNSLESEKAQLQASGQVDPQLNEKAALLKSTLLILNKAIFLTEIFEALCLYIPQTNKFISSELPSICTQENFRLLEKELDISKEFNNVTPERLFAMFEDPSSAESLNFLRYKEIYSELSLVYRFLVRKCIELRMSAELESGKMTDLNYNELLLPLLIRPPKGFYMLYTESSVVDLVLMMMQSDINIIQYMDSDMLLLVQEKLLELLRLYKHLQDKVLNNPGSKATFLSKSTKLESQIDRLLSILSVHSMRMGFIHTPKGYSINFTSKDILGTLDSEISSDMEKCDGSILSVLFYKHLMLQVMLKKEKNSVGDSKLISSKNKLEHLIKLCQSKTLTAEIMDGSLLSGISTNPTITENIPLARLTLGLISSFNMAKLDAIYSANTLIQKLWKLILGKIVNSEHIVSSTLLGRRVGTSELPLTGIPGIPEFINHLFVIKLLKILVEIFNNNLDLSGKSTQTSKIQLEWPKFTPPITQLSRLSGGFVPPLTDVSTMDDSSFFEESEGLSQPYQEPEKVPGPPAPLPPVPTPPTPSGPPVPPKPSISKKPPPSVPPKPKLSINYLKLLQKDLITILFHKKPSAGEKEGQKSPTPTPAPVPIPIPTPLPAQPSLPHDGKIGGPKFSDFRKVLSFLSTEKALSKKSLLTAKYNIDSDEFQCKDNLASLEADVISLNKKIITALSQISNNNDYSEKFDDLLELISELVYTYDLLKLCLEELGTQLDSVLVNIFKQGGFLLRIDTIMKLLSLQKNQILATLKIMEKFELFLSISDLCSEKTIALISQKLPFCHQSTITNYILPDEAEQIMKAHNVSHIQNKRKIFSFLIHLFNDILAFCKHYTPQKLPPKYPEDPSMGHFPSLPSHGEGEKQGGSSEDGSYPQSPTSQEETGNPLQNRLVKLYKEAEGFNEYPKAFVFKILTRSKASNLADFKCTEGIVSNLQIQMSRLEKMRADLNSKLENDQYTQTSGFITSCTADPKSTEFYSLFQLLAGINSLLEYFNMLLDYCRESSNIVLLSTTQAERVVFGMEFEECEDPDIEPIVNIENLLELNHGSLKNLSVFGIRYFLSTFMKLGKFMEPSVCTSEENLNRFRSLIKVFIAKTKKNKSKYSETYCKTSGHVNQNEDCERNNCIHMFERNVYMEKTYINYFFTLLIKEILKECENFNTQEGNQLLEAFKNEFYADCYNFNGNSVINELIAKSEFKNAEKIIKSEINNLLNSQGGLGIIFTSRDCSHESNYRIMKSYLFLSSLKETVIDIIQSATDLPETIMKNNQRRLLTFDAILTLLRKMLAFCLTFSPYEHFSNTVVGVHERLIAHGNKFKPKNVLSGMVSRNPVLRQKDVLKRLQLLINDKYLYSGLDCNLVFLSTILQELRESRELESYYRKETTDHSPPPPSSSTRGNKFNLSSDPRIQDLVKKRRFLFGIKSTGPSTSSKKSIDAAELEINIKIETFYQEYLTSILEYCNGGKIKISDVTKSTKLIKTPLLETRVSSIANKFYFGFSGNLLSDETILLLESMTKDQVSFLNSLLNYFSVNVSGIQNCSKELINKLEKLKRRVLGLLYNLQFRLDNNNYEELKFEISASELRGNNLLVTKKRHGKLLTFFKVISLLLEDILTRCRENLETFMSSRNKKIKIELINSLPSMEYTPENILSSFNFGESIVSKYLDLVSGLDLFGHLTSCLESNYNRLRQRYRELREDFTKLLNAFLNDSRSDQSHPKSHSGVGKGCTGCNYYLNLSTLVSYQLALEYIASAIVACVERATKNNMTGLISDYYPLLGVMQQMNINMILRREVGDFGLTREELKEQLARNYKHLSKALANLIEPKMCTVGFVNENYAIIKKLENKKSDMESKFQFNASDPEYKLLLALIKVFYSLIKYCYSFGLLTLYDSIKNTMEPRFENKNWEDFPNLMDFTFPLFPIEDRCLSEMELFGFDNLDILCGYEGLFDTSNGRYHGPRGPLPGVSTTPGMRPLSPYPGYRVPKPIQAPGPKPPVSKPGVPSTAPEDAPPRVPGPILEPPAASLPGEGGGGSSEYTINVKMDGLSPEEVILDNLDLFVLFDPNIPGNIEEVKKELQNLFIPSLFETVLKLLDGCNTMLLIMINTRIATLLALLKTLEEYQNSQMGSNVGVEMVKVILNQLIAKLRSYLEHCRKLNKYKLPWENVSSVRGRKSDILKLMHKRFRDFTSAFEACEGLVEGEVLTTISENKKTLKNIEKDIKKIHCDSSCSKNQKCSQCQLKEQLKTRKYVLKCSIKRSNYLLEICLELKRLRLKPTVLKAARNALQDSSGTLSVTANRVSLANMMLRRILGHQVQAPQVPGPGPGPGPAPAPGPATGPAPAPGPAPATGPGPSPGSTSPYLSLSEELLTKYAIYMSLTAEGLKIDELEAIAAATGSDLSSLLDSLIENLEAKPGDKSGLLVDPQISESYLLYSSAVSNPKDLEKLIDISGGEKLKLLELMFQEMANSSGAVSNSSSEENEFPEVSPTLPPHLKPPHLKDPPSSPKPPPPSHPTPAPQPSVPTPTPVPQPQKPSVPSASPLQPTPQVTDLSSVDFTLFSKSLIDKYQTSIRKCSQDTREKLELSVAVARAEASHLRTLENHLTKFPCSSSCGNCFKCKASNNIVWMKNNMEKVLLTLELLLSECKKLQGQK